ncbi:MAG: nickel-dependent hydrogenase family protein [Peptococcaceae bacterium]|jgi:Ni,Fe-hydrogenase III large subunit/Ni,Fe-hydrogenase III component G|nr:nickel-dependent hydrogenase family protein [Peptococcaceae bacterium]
MSWHNFSQEILDKFPGTSLFSRRGNEEYLLVPKTQLTEAAQLLTQSGAVLSTMIATDERPVYGVFRLYYVFSRDEEDRFIILVVNITEPDLTYPSLTPLIAAAHWYEREAMDMLGLRPIGHPEPNRLVLHHEWPLGVRPLRKDFNPALQEEGQKAGGGEHRFREVEGEGRFYVPVGPIHAGIIEPGHFRFGTAGENIVHLEARLFYTHRGMEKQAEGLDFRQGLKLAERICGVCAYSHSVAYCEALEKIAGIEIPVRAKLLRTIFLEMERLYNHIGDVGNICAGTGYAFGSSQGGRLKEAIMHHNQLLTGHRYLRGINTPGGLKSEPPASVLLELPDWLDDLGKEFAQFTEVLLSNPIFLDRVNSTGITSLEAVKELGVVGPAARAAGWSRDCRKIHPHAAYSQVDFSVPVYTTGDVAARLKVRIDEAGQSIHIIKQCLEMLEPGEIAEPLGHLPPYQYALGYAESPRGEDMHWLMTGENNTIYRYRVRSASYTNWPVVPLAVRGNIVPDFPLINKSFELCYACLDR